MQVLEYERKDKTKARAVDIESVLEDMSAAEDFQGTAEGKIYESWYALKRELAAALLQVEKEGG